VKQNSLPPLVEEQSTGFSYKVKDRKELKYSCFTFLYGEIYMVRKMQDQKNGKPYSYKNLKNFI
jgi:hypothetical protein